MRQYRIYCEAVTPDKLERFEFNLASAFGGFTKYPAKGAYVNKAGTLEFEDSVVYEFIECVSDPVINILAERYAEELRDLAGQESVLLTYQDINGGLI